MRPDMGDQTFGTSHLLKFKSWPFIISPINSESYILHNITETPATSIEIYHLSNALVK